MRARQGFETGELRLGFRAAVSLDQADADIDPVGPGALRRAQHGEGLADTGRRAEKHLELAASRPLGVAQQGFW